MEPEKKEEVKEEPAYKKLQREKLPMRLIWDGRNGPYVKKLYGPIGTPRFSKA